MEKNKINRLIKLIVITVFIVIALIAMLLVKNLVVVEQKTNEFNDKLSSINWPNEVPLAYSENMELNHVDHEWVVNIPEGFTYEMFKNYLKQLEQADFVPNKLDGSRSYKYLNSLPGSSEIAWSAYKDSYFIVVYWGDYGKSDEFGMLIDYNLSISLRDLSQIPQRDVATNTDEVLNFGENISGENVPSENVPSENISGENVSGDKLSNEKEDELDNNIVSGENILNDTLSEN